MASVREICDEVRARLAKDLPHQADAVSALSDDADLFESGLIDSLSFLNLVTFLEERYGIAVPADEFAPSHLPTLSRIAEYVIQKNGSLR